MLITNSLLISSVIKVRHWWFVSHKLGRELTREIIHSHSPKDLKTIVIKNSGSFNVMNLTALLKQVNKLRKADQQLTDTVFAQIKRSWRCIYSSQVVEPRAIANIIGYTGNLRYHGLDQQLQIIEYSQLFKSLKPKQFVMTITGLLKLEIFEQCVKGVDLETVILSNVDHLYQVGLTISLWRNLIKYGKSTTKLNRYLSSLILVQPLNFNLKDYGYLVYSFTRVYQDLENRHRLEEVLSNYSQAIVTHTRINMFEMCILMDHLRQLRDISPHVKAAHQLTHVLQMHYIRNISAKIDLRSLANGYHSLINYIEQPTFQTHNQTVNKFIESLKKFPNSSDYQSISSLFLQVLEYSHKGLNQTIKQVQNLLRAETEKLLLKQITQFLLLRSPTHLQHIPNKQFQKILYAYYVYITKTNRNYVIEQELRIRICDDLIKREFTENQLVSLIPICSVLGVVSPAICWSFRQKINVMGKDVKNRYKLLGRMSGKCIMGRNDCLNCFV